MNYCSFRASKSTMWSRGAAHGKAQYPAFKGFMLLIPTEIDELHKKINLEVAKSGSLPCDECVSIRCSEESKSTSHYFRNL